MKKSKLLDGDLVIKALEMAKNEIYIPSYYGQGGDDITESIRSFVHNETKVMIETAINSFVSSLTLRLRDCEVENYPCALCYEEEETDNG